MAIALLSDFGTKDYFVGAMKGVILGLSGEAPIVDITHEISPQNIKEAAFCLAACYADFPHGTIFVAVVDPGVGSERRGIALRAGKRYFVAPDNGILTGIITKESDIEPHHLVNEDYFRQPVSNTFHGRDIFAPVAAHIFNGTELGQFGPSCEALVTLPETAAVVAAPDRAEGVVIHIDKFGNIITNIGSEMIPVGSVELCGSIVTKGVKTFSESEPGDLVFLPGSAGFIEICQNLGNASDALGAKVGDVVIARP